MAPHRGPADSKIVLPRKGAHPLLKTINGVSRDTYDASSKSRVSPATDDEPQSSSEESENTSPNSMPITNGGRSTANRHEASSIVKPQPRSQRGNGAIDIHKTQFTGRNLRSRQEASHLDTKPQDSARLSKKRHHDELDKGDELEILSEDEVDMDMFGELKSSQPSRRMKTFSRAAGKAESPKRNKTTNIFTKQRDGAPAKNAKQNGYTEKTYGQGKGKGGTKAEGQPGAVTFRMPPSLKDIDQISEASSGSQPQFRMRSLDHIPDSSADKGPEFRVRSYGDSNTSSISSSPLSSPPTTNIPDSPPPILDLTGSDGDILSLAKRECPMCSAPVALSFYESWGFARRVGIQEQAQFCRAHKRKDAEDQWQAKGYPNIDWDNFDKRLVQFHGYVQDILDLKIPSFYRNLLEEKIRSGRNRTMMQSLGSNYFEVLKPGYYGSRGARAIQEYITHHFSRALRRLSASDSLVSSGGVSSYIQCVLVPEIAVMLVKQDMKIPNAEGWEEKARTIMQESRAVGDELCEELEDRAENVDIDAEEHTADL